MNNGYRLSLMHPDAVAIQQQQTAMTQTTGQKVLQTIGRLSMIDLERNKAIVRAYFDECWNKGNLEFGRSIIADDYDFHLPLPPDFPHGFKGWKLGVGFYLAAFPDCHWDIRQIVAEDDLVSVRSVWTATHRGEFMGVPASGHRVVVANSDYYRLRDGKLVEHWDVPDYLAILRQIGGRLDDVPPMFAASVEA